MITYVYKHQNSFGFLLQFLKALLRMPVENRIRHITFSSLLIFWKIFSPWTIFKFKFRHQIIGTGFTKKAENERYT